MSTMMSRTPDLDAYLSPVLTVPSRAEFAHHSAGETKTVDSFRVFQPYRFKSPPRSSPSSAPLSLERNQSKRRSSRESSLQLDSQTTFVRDRPLEHKEGIMRSPWQRSLKIDRTSTTTLLSSNQATGSAVASFYGGRRAPRHWSHTEVPYPRMRTSASSSRSSSCSRSSVATNPSYSRVPENPTRSTAPRASDYLHLVETPTPEVRELPAKAADRVPLSADQDSAETRRRATVDRFRGGGGDEQPGVNAPSSQRATASPPSVSLSPDDDLNHLIVSPETHEEVDRVQRRLSSHNHQSPPSSSQQQQQKQHQTPPQKHRSNGSSAVTALLSGSKVSPGMSTKILAGYIADLEDDRAELLARIQTLQSDRDSAEDAQKRLVREFEVVKLELGAARHDGFVTNLAKYQRVERSNVGIQVDTPFSHSAERPPAEVLERKVNRASKTSRHDTKLLREPNSGIPINDVSTRVRSWQHFSGNVSSSEAFHVSQPEAVDRAATISSVPPRSARHSAADEQPPPPPYGVARKSPRVIMSPVPSATDEVLREVHKLQEDVRRIGHKVDFTEALVVQSAATQSYPNSSIGSFGYSPPPAPFAGGSFVGGWFANQGGPWGRSVSAHSVESNTDWMGSYHVGGGGAAQAYSDYPAALHSAYVPPNTSLASRRALLSPAPEAELPAAGVPTHFAEQHVTSSFRSGHNAQDCKEQPSPQPLLHSAPSRGLEALAAERENSVAFRRSQDVPTTASVSPPSSVASRSREREHSVEYGAQATPNAKSWAEWREPSPPSADHSRRFGQRETPAVALSYSSAMQQPSTQGSRESDDGGSVTTTSESGSSLHPSQRFGIRLPPQLSVR